MSKSVLNKDIGLDATKQPMFLVRFTNTEIRYNEVSYI